MARPRKKIDWKTVANLCGIQCTLAEISSVLDVSDDTIQRACQREHKMPFGDYLKRHRLKGFVSIRRKQYEVATAGNVSMLIWLGKNWLDQRDQPDPPMPDESEFYETVSQEMCDAVFPPGSTPATAVPRPDLPPGAMPSVGIGRPIEQQEA
jgi:hypothetical protein